MSFFAHKINALNCMFLYVCKKHQVNVAYNPMGKGIPRPDKKSGTETVPAFVWCLKIVLIRFSGSEALRSLWRRDTQGPWLSEMTLGAIFYSHVLKQLKTVFVASVFGNTWSDSPPEKTSWFLVLIFGGSDNYFSLNHELQVAGSNSWGIRLPPISLWFYEEVLSRFWT